MYFVVKSYKDLYLLIIYEKNNFFLIFISATFSIYCKFKHVKSHLLFKFLYVSQFLKLFVYSKNVISELFNKKY
jgi:hypothetical protein